ncbi:meprin A subunit beta-like [Liolophura sinensis]|uniref:meprin A subunit beta-like n=1 Tax=Liolophura sinensis TaxID=3198878 RepID=UPI0031583562
MRQPADRRPVQGNMSAHGTWPRRNTHEFPAFLRRQERSVVRPRDWLWHDREIPYILSSSIGLNVRKAFHAAVKDIEESSCLKFKRRNNEEDYLFISSMDGCWSDVGRVGGKQDVSLAENCNSKGIALHELLHALGFWHEHCRLDRDQHIQIMWQNIEDGLDYNFDKHDWLYNDLQELPYDYDSIMHYNAYSFSANRKPTIVPIGNTDKEIGQRRGMSELDAKKLNKLYSCDKPHGWSSWGDWSPCSNECLRIRERFCIGVHKKRCQGDSQQIETCPSTCYPVNRFGCWKYDRSNPSISSLEGRTTMLRTMHLERIDPIRQCADAAGALGYKVFALTNDSVCLSSPTAHLTYMRDGPSESCTYIDRGKLDSMYAFTLEFDAAVDGQWGMWSEWSKCSVTCGTGSMTRNRICNNPEPDNGGRECVGNDQATEQCHMKDCLRWFYPSG